MNNKTKRTQREAPGSCVFQGVGPVLSELLRRLAPPAEARGHFDNARLEFLKGLRALIDARIAHVSKAARSKGEKVRVE